MSKDRMPHHRDRAESFLQTMRLVAEDQECSYSVPLLAIHSAISLADAVLIGCTGRRASDVNHKETVKALKDLCVSRRRSGDGVAHLSWLLERKTPLIYGDSRLEIERDVKGARLRAERFVSWAYGAFPEIARADGGES